MLGMLWSLTLFSFDSSSVGVIKHGTRGSEENYSSCMFAYQGLWKLLKVEGVQLRGHFLSPPKNSNINRSFPIQGNLNAHLQHLLEGFSFIT